MVQGNMEVVFFLGVRVDDTGVCWYFSDNAA